jgi:hypothetical protein
MQMECIERRVGMLAPLAVDPARHRLEQLTGVLEIAAPQQGDAFAGLSVRRIGCHPIVGNRHASGRRQTGLGAPNSTSRLAVLCPCNPRIGGWKIAVHGKEVNRSWLVALGPTSPPSAG